MARMRQNLTVLGVEKCQSPITPCHPRRSPPNTRVDTHKTLHDTLRHGEFVPGGVHGDARPSFMVLQASSRRGFSRNEVRRSSRPRKAFSRRARPPS